MTASERYERNKIKRLIKRMKAEEDVHEAARLAEIAYRKIKKVRAMRQDDEEWISLENGTHILIEEESGKVVSGAGGALNGETLSAAQSTENEKKSSNENNGGRSRNRSRESAGGNRTEPAGTAKFGGATSTDFCKALADAKSTVAEKDRWRVDTYSAEDMDEYHPNSKLHITDGGSTVAVTTEGDIISVCHKDGDTTRGRDLLQMAVENGGDRLDAYDGLYGFYIRCGFEPVSWCKWDPEYKPDGWNSEKGCKEENVIFFKYTGNSSTYSTKESFYSAVSASSDYGEAQKSRNANIETKRG